MGNPAACWYRRAIRMERSGMAKVFKRIILTLLMVVVGYGVAVQVLRWVAFGDEEREALALMERPVPVPQGSSGFKYLAFTELAVPPAELDEALAREVAAFSAWDAGQGERIIRGELGHESTEVYTSPNAGAYPVRAAVPFPERACGFREANCIVRVTGNEEAIRDWLTRDADRLDLAWQAARSDHLANPYPWGADTPLVSYQLFRLPINAVALQAIEGDIAGAQARACELLASSRRFLRQDGLLVDKMMNATLTQGAAALVLEIRRADPDAPLPGECGAALEPVVAEDYLVCNSLRSEHAMLARFSGGMEQALASRLDPRRLAWRWLLVEDRLQRAWTARGFAPLCREENLSRIANGQLPQEATAEFSKRSIDYWAAPMSKVLASIATPAYVPYQQRLLDQAAILRLQLAAIAHASGGLDAGQVGSAAASPGYTISHDAEGWRLLLLSSHGSNAPEFFLRLGASPAIVEVDRP